MTIKLLMFDFGVVKLIHVLLIVVCFIICNELDIH